MAEVVEITCLKELKSHRLAWNALLPQTPGASLPNTCAWLESYWQHFGRGQRLRVLVIRSHGKTIGIVPLCVRTERYHLGSVRVLGYAMRDWGTSCGAIGPNQTASLLMAMQHIQRTPQDWDLLDLRWLAAGPDKNNPVRLAIKAAGWAPQQSAYRQVSVIRFADSDWPSYRAQLSKKWGQEIGRLSRALPRDYALTFERHRPSGTAHGDNDPRWDLYDACVQIAQQSRQGDSTTANALCHSDERAFLRDCHGIAAHLGMLDVAVLKLDGKPAAFQYNYHYDGRLQGLQMGFDRQYGGQGVGSVLMSQLIEDSFTRGDRNLDLCKGELDFNRRFRSGVETSYRYSCYPWTAWRSQGVRLSRWIKQRTSAAS